MLRRIVSTGFFFSLSFFISITASAGGPSVKVLTYNIWGLPLGISKDLPARVKMICEVLKEKSKAPDGWDVIVFQEAWQVLDQKHLKKCGYPYSATFDKTALSSGLMMLSKYPFSEKKRVKYPGYGFDPEAFFDGEGIARKSGVMAKIQHPDIGPIWIANTHLAANYFKPRHYYTGHRRAQFEMFSSFIMKYADNLPVIMGGDLNFASTGKSYEPIWDEIPKLLPGFQEADSPSSTCTHCPTNSYNANGDDEGRIDHLFGSDAFTPRDGKVVMTEKYNIGKKKKAVNLSDHFGWETVFEFRGQTVSR